MGAGREKKASNKSLKREKIDSLIDLRIPIKSLFRILFFRKERDSKPSLKDKLAPIFFFLIRKETKSVKTFRCRRW